MSSAQRFVARRSWPAWMLPLALLLGCGADKVEVKNLFLEISSEAPPDEGRLESLRILFQKGDVRYPAVVTEAAFNPMLGALDPVKAPVFFSVAYQGGTFGDGRDVELLVTGRIGNASVARFEGQVDLDLQGITKVRLVVLPANCDVDGDGFLDCGVSGCCVEGSVFGDCGATDAGTNPWALEAACEPCSDTVDQDCRGGDEPCVDTDQDQIADCAEETCGKDDPKSGPGLPEICDGKDNDCDSQTDEGLTLNYLGKTLDKGNACGKGACAGGMVECDGTGGLRCSSDARRAVAEVCGNDIDENCNGRVNEGCDLADFDGDGVLLPEDCNDFDAGVYPGRTGEPCCAPGAEGDPVAEKACDLNCDGNVAFCEQRDLDGDGVTVAEGDCNDNDAQIAPGKPEKCGDGVDQDCSDGDLPCAGLIDADGDGWSNAVDCNDNEAAVRPDALELCNGVDDDCNFAVDEGNPGGGERCGTTDEGDCSFGVLQCQNSVGVAGAIVCVGNVEPQALETCDGHDEDCDGQTDEDFRYLDLAIGQGCHGVGACGPGLVECALGRTDLATCSTNAAGSASEATTEACDPVDNDCDGEINEGLDDVTQSTCHQLGVCHDNLSAIVATCTLEGLWTCDYSNVPGYEEGHEISCDMLDNDCDGTINEDLTFTEPGGAVRPFGLGCDGADSDRCKNGVVACDAVDATRTTCLETGEPHGELCDGLDNDCDGETDEDFKATSSNRVKLSGALLAADNGAFLGEACGAGACAGGAVVCATAQSLKCSTDPRTAGSPNPPVDSCDGSDNDCDGATDEAFIAGGSVKLQNALFSADNGKVKGATCGSGECAGGTVICKTLDALGCSTDGNGHTTLGGQTVTKTDTCNGKDDNCNGTTDDDFVTKTGPAAKPLAGAAYTNDNGKVKGASCGIGQCLKDPASGASSPGQVVCAADGTKLLCSSDTRVTTEVCDNLDNDCDGMDDDPFRSAAGSPLAGAKLASDNGKVKGATCGAGSCADGKVVCSSDKSKLVCDSEFRATLEICDELDNDCDGTRNEGYTYEGFAWGATCDGIGACGMGTVACVVGVTNAATCSTNPNGPQSGEATETCDAEDNDCDGATDEGFTYKTAALNSNCTGDGACGAGTVVCSSDPSKATCSTMPDGTNPQSSPELCDGLDNDCNGTDDDGFDIGTDCDGVGECGAGVIECASTSASTCSTNPGRPGYDGSAETCNDLDDDCDGVTDNGFTFTDATNTVRNVGQSCDGIGECGIGVVECASVSAARCSTNPDGSAHDDVLETCNDLDDDCDSLIDEDYPSLLAAYDSHDLGKAKAAACGTGVCGVGVVQCNAAQTALVCSTNVAPQGIEICDAFDNDCDSLTDEGTADIDADLICDEIDNCQLVANPLQDDMDNDFVGGACDNCPVDPNASQTDTNVNGIGDVCDPCTVSPISLTEPHEVCGDCLDNDCSGSTDVADSPCTYRRIIGIETDVSGVVAGHSISLTLDHAFLVATGNSRGDGSGDDVRVYYRNPSTGTFTEIDRALDPESAWNIATTKIWFKAQDPITADIADGDEVNRDYYLYANVAGTAKKNEDNVFYFADFFDRTMGDITKVGPDTSIDAPPIDAWAETETATGKLAITNTVLGSLVRSLTFTTKASDEDMRPVAYRVFSSAITSGRWLWRTKWNWARTGEDNSYALFAQLGDSGAGFVAAPAAGSTYPSAGVGPVVAWGKTIWGFAASGIGDLASTNGTVITNGLTSGVPVVDEFDGSSQVAVLVDFGTKKFSVDPDGDLSGFSANIDFNNANLTKLDAIRLVSHHMDGDQFSPKKFDYVVVQRMVPSGELEPIAYLGVKEPLGPTCTVDGSPLGRWYLDDDRDDALGSETTVLSDIAASPLDFMRTADGGQPALVDAGTQHGLSWAIDSAGGSALVAYTGTKLNAASTGLDDSKTATIEFVAEIMDTAAESFIVDFQRDTFQHQLAVAIGTSTSTYVIKVYLNNIVVGEWTANVASMGRTVFTIVVNTGEAEASRLKLYRDGELLLLDNAATPPVLDTLIDVTDSGTLRIGNSAAGTSSPWGYIYYTAVYQAALAETLVRSNANVLRADDDRR